MLESVFSVAEHTNIESEMFDDKRLQEFNKCYDERDGKYLGIHQTKEEYQYKLKSDYYIGYVWLDEKKEKYIHVFPKSLNDQKGKADYLSMFLTCADDPVVSTKLDDVYKIYFNQKSIDIEQKKDIITPFLVVHFLKIVHKISQKGLKKGYVKITENLASRIKGRIMINQTIKHNHFRGRLDKTVCNHQVFTVDCMENQIIKTALMQCSRHLLIMKNDEEIVKQLKYNLSTFDLVNTVNITSNDFSKIKHSPFYKEYKEAINLAKMIFQRFGFSLDSSIKENTYKTPPFYINMPELFERYVEVQLRKQKDCNVIDGNRLSKELAFRMRPDFLIPTHNMIVDAKYKPWFGKKECNDFKDDYKQLSLYGREQTIREYIRLDKNENKEAVLLFIYPKARESKAEEHTLCDISKWLSSENFNQIYKVPIALPIKEI